MIKIGLKSNANFLFSEMQGDTLGGTDGSVLFRSIVHLDDDQFIKFKCLIESFGGDVDKSLVVSDSDDADYECYFTKLES